MQTQVIDRQLEWHPALGGRYRFRLAAETDWSGWHRLAPADATLASMLLSQQPVWYNALTGALSVSLGETASPQAPADFTADAWPVPTPNAGDDADAEPAGPVETDQVAPAAEQLAATVRPWRTARSLLVLREQLNRRYPGRATGSDGTIGDLAHQGRHSDHNPNIIDGNYGVVTALDITHDPASGCDAGRLARALAHSRDPRIKYVIWNRQIAVAPALAWQPYAGTNPHIHHLHLSVKGQKAAYDDPTPWKP